MPEDIKDQEQTEMMLSGEGVPYKSEQLARAAIIKKGLDPEGYLVKSFEDGYAIVPKPKIIPEKYYKVRFNEKQGPNDENDVFLSVNGESIVIERGKEVVIPGRFKEAADHATYPYFTQRDPNSPRKQVGEIKVFPYSLISEASEAEYRAQISEGTKKTKEALAAQDKLV